MKPKVIAVSLVCLVIVFSVWINIAVSLLKPKPQAHRPTLTTTAVQDLPEPLWIRTTTAASLRLNDAGTTNSWQVYASIDGEHPEATLLLNFNANWKLKLLWSNGMVDEIPLEDVTKWLLTNYVITVRNRAAKPPKEKEVTP